MMRAIWSGHITFGLISIPVGLHAAVESSERVSFRLLHKKDMAPIKYKKFCSKEDIEVPNDEIVKGYEVEKKKFAVVEKEELEEVQKSVGEGDRSIDVLQFVDLASLNPLSFEKPYYVTPQKGGEKAYTVLRDALMEARRVGIAKFFLRTRPLLGALIPGPEALALEVLRPFEELREPADVGAPAAGKKAAGSGEVKMARLLIDQMSEEWDPTQHPDEYRQALEKLLASKRKFAVPTEERARGEEGKVVNLMEALRKSIEKSGGRAKAAKARRSGARKAGAA
jgi:DNA end-binding protein Ku